MKRWSLILLALACVPLSAQKAAPRRLAPLDVHSKQDFEVSEVDRFTGTAKLVTHPRDLARINCNGLGAALGVCTDVISLAWRRSISRQGDTTFAFDLEYCGTAWMFMPRDGDAFGLLINGEPTTFSPLAPPQTDASGCYATASASGHSSVSESALFAVTPQQMFAIARADSLVWRLYGSRGYKEGKVNLKNLASLRLFLATIFPDSMLYEKP